MHLRLEIGRWWLQIGRAEPPEPEQSEYRTDHPTPQVIYPPERVGFYRLPDETD